MARISYLLCLLLAIFTIVTADYCNTSSCNEKGSHTMCLYSSTPAAACGNSYSTGLSDDDKQKIVNKHNELRRKVASGDEKRGKPGPQPAAVSMPGLTWDNELAEIAQRWANQCKFGHDKCRNVDRYAVGQNVAATYNSAENNSPVESMVQMWYDEVADFDRNKVEKYEFESDTGHYTQVVWAKTTKIGCGQTNYKEDGWNKKYLVCNYGPAGNWIGEKIYEVRR